MKWAVELGQYEITYKPRMTIKSQAIADFIVDFASRTNEILNIKKNHQWTLEVDGASNTRGGGIDLALTSPN